MTKANEIANLIQQAKQALLAGDSARAMLLAEQILSEDPNNSDAKLILAGFSSPENSLKLVQEALESDPNNPFAHKALQWAGEQSRQKSASQWQTLSQAETADLDETAPIPVFVPTIETKTSEKVEAEQATIGERAEDAPKKRKALLPYVFLLLAALTGFVLYSVGIIRPKPVAGDQFQIKNDTAKLLKPSLTPTKTEIPTATPSPTAINTPEPSPTPTEIPTATPTEEVIPTVLVEPIVYEPDTWDESEPVYDEEVYVEPLNGKWIDINLSSQTLSAYENDTLVNSYLISSGRPGNETVTGTYYVYVKHRYADMAGPGYYLADVPYVMYFYLGYGIHGTYWHDNFGTPMSAGCINMETGAAAWLYDWAYVGIPVSVHY